MRQRESTQLNSIGQFRQVPSVLCGCCTQSIFIVHRERMAGKNFGERHSGFLRISNPCVEIRELQLGIIRSCGIATCKAIRET